MGLFDRLKKRKDVEGGNPPVSPLQRGEGYSGGAAVNGSATGRMYPDPTGSVGSADGRRAQWSRPTEAAFGTGNPSPTGRIGGASVGGGASGAHVGAPLRGLSEVRQGAHLRGVSMGGGPGGHALRGLSEVQRGVQNLAGKPAIGTEQIHQAQAVLQQYKAGKAALEQRIIANEQWYKLRHWEQLRRKDKNEGEQVEPVSAWLFNSIANKHADAMDNYPQPNLLPREEQDRNEAKMLSAIIPVLLDQCEFEQTYSEAWDDKLKGGTGIYGVFWDNSKAGSLGDIDIRKIDVVNLFWQPGICDIQKSRNVFHVELMDNELLEEAWPQLKGSLGSATIDVARYVYDDSVDTSNMSAVVDWYYKKRIGGRQVLHFCKFVNDKILYASENDPELSQRGWYDHGLYPFVFDTLYRVKGSPCGFGFIDVAKSAQEYIDRGNQAIMKNMLANATPRHFIRSDGSVNEEEYLDLSKPLIHVDGQLGKDSILPVSVNTLSSIYVEILNNKIDELKETTGNRDISTGGSTSGVTAASAIAAMQEAGSKLSRDNNKAAYRAFRKVVMLMVELIRQFYDISRCFRITGENGKEQFVHYNSRGIQPQAQGVQLGLDMGYRLPLFDIEITAQKASPYSKMSQNELALQFYGQGFFLPQNADQTLACLEMMDFDRKDFVIQKVAQNGGMFQQMMQMQQQIQMLVQMLEGQKGNPTGQMAGAPGMPAPAPTGKSKGAGKVEALGGKTEEAVVTKARQRVAESTAPK